MRTIIDYIKLGIAMIVILPSIAVIFIYAFFEFIFKSRKSATITSEYDRFYEHY
jgi:hypothetical protein